MREDKKKQRIIFLCNTFYQLIVAMQMRYSLFPGDHASLMLSDHSSGAGEVAERLRSCGAFDTVDFVKTLEVFKGKGRYRYRVFHLIDGILGNLYGAKLGGDDRGFDLFCFYNYDYVALGVCSALTKKNRELSCYRFEEGLLCYNSPVVSNTRIRWAEKIQHGMSGGSLRERTKGFYCFWPRLCALDGVREIPRIEAADKRLRTAVSTAFLDPTEDYSISEKYIFLMSIADVCGTRPVGELEIVKRIADIVGTHDLLVKIHPRDDARRIESEGLKVYPHAGVPWEAIQMTQDFRDKVLLTTTSSGAISYNMMCAEPIRTYFFYEMCDFKDNPTAYLLEDLERYRREGIFEKLGAHVIGNLDDFVRMEGIYGDCAGASTQEMKEREHGAAR